MEGKGKLRLMKARVVMKKCGRVRRILCILAVFAICFVATVQLDTQAAGKVTVSMKNSSAQVLKGNKVSVKAGLKNSKIKKVSYSSNKKSVATVNSSGIVTAKKAGTAKITATVTASNKKKYKKTISIYVKTKATSKSPYLSLSGKSTLLMGNKAVVSRTLKSSKSSISSTSYKSSNSKVIAVNSKGEMTPKKAGSATITVTGNTKNGHTLYGKRKVTVYSKANSKTSYISISVPGANLFVNQVVNAKTSLKNAGETSISSISYKSSNTAVAVVDGKGRITPKKAGMFTLTVTAKTKDKQILSKLVKLTVKNVEPTNVTVSGSGEIMVGKTAVLKASISPSNTTDKSITWESDDAAIVTVDKSGTIKGIKPGVTHVRALSCNEAVYGYIRITVTALNVQPTSVEIKGPVRIAQHYTGQYTAAVLPGNATDRSVSWKSSNTNVAAVDSAGLVRGVGEGTAIITATTVNGKSASKEVKVEFVKGSGSGTNPVWVEPVYETQTVWVVDKVAWVEKVPVYEYQIRGICSVCGEDITEELQGGIEDHLKGHTLAGEGGGYYTDYREVQIDTEYINHPEVGREEQRKVLVTPGYWK